VSKQNGTVNIHGREYKTVALRVAEFRETYKLADGWGIVTELLHVDADVVRVRAAVTTPDGRTVATGMAEERRTASQINKTSALENCETSAVGRALAAAGLGGSEYASADEVANALKNQSSTPQAARGTEGGKSKVKKEDVSTDRDTATDGGAGGLAPTKTARPPNGSKKTKKAANPQTACKWAYADSAKNLGTDAKVLGTAFAKWLGFAAVAVGGDAAALMDKPNDPRWAKLAILAGNPSYTTENGEWVPGDVGQDVQDVMNHAASEAADQQESNDA